MDDGDLTDIMKRSIIFLSRTMSLGKGGQKNDLKGNVSWGSERNSSRRQWSLDS